MGLLSARRRQPQEEAVRLVVCGLCRPVRWRAPNRVLVIQDSVDPREAKVFRSHAAPQGLCANLVNLLKLLTNQQKYGDSPVENIVTGLWEKSRKGIKDGLWKFIEVDNREAVNVGGLRQGIKSVMTLLLQRFAPGGGNQEAWRESTQIRRGLWEEHQKSPVAALAKALECLEATMNVEVCFHRSLMSESAESLGRALLGRDVALSGSLGCCGIAHDTQHLECPEEVWAAWRALLLPIKERTGRPQGGGGLWALYPSGENESVCYVRFAHDGREALWYS